MHHTTLLLQVPKRKTDATANKYNFINCRRREVVDAEGEAQIYQSIT
jgi:hypothetical protein